MADAGASVDGVAEGGSPSDLTLDDVRRDWRCLHRADVSYRPDVRLISHERFSTSSSGTIQPIEGDWASRVLRRFRWLSDAIVGYRLLRAADADTVVIVNGGCPVWILAGLMNRLLRYRRRIVCWDIMIETRSRWRRRILRAAVLGIDLSIVWSRKQVPAHARFLGVPEDRFLFIPYKANHSRQPSQELPIGNYVFAGGNGKRDYRCLVDAVRGTGIPVVISATDPAVRSRIEALPNVIALAAWEPAFAQLQAGCRFAVVPMISTGIKGGGEANFCNAMWHGRPVIAADDMAAHEYVEDGVTGYVVPSGDHVALRDRIVSLWADPDRTRRMGSAGRERVERFFTHQRFIDRLVRVALLLGAQRARGRRPEVRRRAADVPRPPPGRSSLLRPSSSRIAEAAGGGHGGDPMGARRA